MREFDVSVAIVIPVGPDYGHLPEQLAALAGQEDPLEAGVEIVLSCNGSDQAEVERLAARVGWPANWRVRAIDSSERRGPSHARNAGWRSTAAELVVFCDADDLVGPTWLAGLADELESAELVSGVFDYKRLNPGGVGTWGEVGVTALPRKFRHLPFVPSGNLGAHRALLELLGGFDESFDRSEDVDFSWRAQYSGARVAMAPGALLSVRRRESGDALFKQAREDAHFDVPLLHRHREHGALWSVRDLLREAAGVAVALVQAPFGGGYRAKLSTRSGRFIGHILAAPRMLRG